MAGNSVLALDTTNASGGAFAYSGNIAGGFGLTKLGAGTLTLSGNNTYSGNISGSGAVAVTTGTLTLTAPIPTPARPPSAPGC